MKNTQKLTLILSLILILTECKPKKEILTTPESYLTSEDTIPYRASVRKINSLVHTELELTPNFENREVEGKAYITLKPHYYPTDSLMLNAKYMKIKSVKLASNNTDLKYKYDSLFLNIKLDKTYTRNETYKLLIEYTAQPEKVKRKKSAAITDNKGVYFINPDNDIPNYPVQIWTQCETEEASCWFPTIDAPNQKTTETISLTVPNEYRTISNGKLISSTPVGEKLRTDKWEQKLPHAPYLFAFVIGKFAEIKDKWNDKEVNYYVEPEYEKYAKMVFGNTPKMIEFYSQALNLKYPWDKYHQVVVRDFVSGAMENTGCVIHYDKLQHNEREHLDNTQEDIIAHELFHHWFGDYVTCESWSNLPLNESFATYGEYLWNEYQYGRDEADVKLNNFHVNYFNEANYKEEKLIRYHYVEQNDMFDRHSYQKGGAILHMLRKYVGDEAFFASLNLYLTKNAYKTVEIHDLRLAFEEITGEDLNWFFNQWFLGKGHPSLTVKHNAYDAINKKASITVLQNPLQKLFKLPIDIDVVTDAGIKRHRIMVEKDSQIFEFKTDKPQYVLFDAENQLLAYVDEEKPASQWNKQMQNAKLKFHQSNALIYANLKEQDQKVKIENCKKLINNSFWYCRKTALEELNKIEFIDSDVADIKPDFVKMALNDRVRSVRSETVPILEKLKDEDLIIKMLKDSSYNVISSALNALVRIKPTEAYGFADDNRDEQNNTLQQVVYTALGQTSTKNELDFFIQKIKKGSKTTGYNAAEGLALFVTLNQIEKTKESLNELDALVSDKSNSNYVIENGFYSLETIKNIYSFQLIYIEYYIKESKENKAQLAIRKKEINDYLNLVNNILKKHNRKGEENE